jgi:hypothetical protein
MNVKEPKEVVIARISARQAVIVALIGLFSAVVVVSITNLDKLMGTDNEVAKEIGYYEARAGNVESAARRVEAELQARGASARQSEDREEADQLMALADEVRAVEKKVLEGHGRHLEAIKNGKRVVASEIKLEVNEEIVKLNLKLFLKRNNIKMFREAGRIPYDAALVTHELMHSQPFIPLYGKGKAMQEREQVCELKKSENPGRMEVSSDDAFVIGE